MGLFDFNGDGKTSLGEKWIAYNIYKECTKDDESDDDAYLYDDEEDYSWRDECEDGFDYGLDAEDYETLEEYEEALEEAKNDLESEQDDEEEDNFDIAIPIELEVSVDCFNKEKSSALSTAREEALQGALNDKSIYHYCGVVYENSSYPYHYRTNDTSLKIGDKVIVPVGAQNKEVVAEVVSVEQHTRLTVPYPVEKCKFILRKCDE